RPYAVWGARGGAYRSDLSCVCVVFLFRFTAPSLVSRLSLHDALPIFTSRWPRRWACLMGYSSSMRAGFARKARTRWGGPAPSPRDRKSTRLNSSHVSISYAVFCLKKKNHLRTVTPVGAIQRPGHAVLH